MSGVPAFTAGEADAVTTAVGLARDVVAATLTYAPSAGVEEVYDDLTNALTKLAAMRAAVIETETQEVPDGAAHHL